MKFDLQEQMPPSFLAEIWRLQSTCCSNELDEAIHMLLGLLRMVLKTLQNHQPSVIGNLAVYPHLGEQIL